MWCMCGGVERGDGERGGRREGRKEGGVFHVSTGEPPAASLECSQRPAGPSLQRQGALHHNHRVIAL